MAATKPTVPTKVSGDLLAASEVNQFTQGLKDHADDLDALTELLNTPLSPQELAALVAYLQTQFDARYASIGGTAPNAAPVASTPTITGLSSPPKVGETAGLAATRTDAESDPAGTPVIKWYRANDTSGTGKTLITTASTYLLATADLGKCVAGEYTPTSTTGTLTGTPVLSAWSAVIVAATAGQAITWTDRYNTVVNGTVLSLSGGAGNGNARDTAHPLPAGSDGRYVMAVPGTTGTGCMGLTAGTNNESTADAGMWVWQASNGGPSGRANGTYTNDSVGTPISGPNARLAIEAIGSTLRARFSTDGGTTWTTYATLARPAGTLTLKAFLDSGAPGDITDATFYPL